MLFDIRGVPFEYLHIGCINGLYPKWDVCRVANKSLISFGKKILLWPLYIQVEVVTNKESMGVIPALK